MLQGRGPSPDIMLDEYFGIHPHLFHSIQHVSAAFSKETGKGEASTYGRTADDGETVHKCYRMKKGNRSRCLYLSRYGARLGTTPDAALLPPPGGRFSSPKAFRPAFSGDSKLGRRRERASISTGGGPPVHLAFARVYFRRPCPGAHEFRANAIEPPRLLFPAVRKRRGAIFECLSQQPERGLQSVLITDYAFSSLREIATRHLNACARCRDAECD